MNFSPRDVPWLVVSLRSRECQSILLAQKETVSNHGSPPNSSNRHHHTACPRVLAGLAGETGKPRPSAIPKPQKDDCHGIRM